MSDKDLEHLKETCSCQFCQLKLSVLIMITPLKSTFIRAKPAPFINEEIQRAVVVRSKLRKKN